MSLRFRKHTATQCKQVHYMADRRWCKGWGRRQTTFLTGKVETDLRRVWTRTTAAGQTMGSIRKEEDTVLASSDILSSMGPFQGSNRPLAGSWSEKELNGSLTV